MPILPGSTPQQKFSFWMSRLQRSPAVFTPILSAPVAVHGNAGSGKAIEAIATVVREIQGVREVVSEVGMGRTSNGHLQPTQQREKWIGSMSGTDITEALRTRDPLWVDVPSEIARIQEFITREAGAAPVVVGLSGGLDSDVLARLSVGAVGPGRVRVFTVLQADMEEAHVRNSRTLALDLGLNLVQLRLADFPRHLVAVLGAAETREKFSPASLLDVGKAKNSLRTWVFSMYAERGYLVAGCSNRTEIETGFYLPFGDGLAHILPIGHLYKTQVFRLARAIGTRPEVIQQPPSAGYWRGETDLEDLAFWMYHGAPVLEELRLGDEALATVRHIRRELTFEAIDRGLHLIGEGSDPETIGRESGLGRENSERLRKLTSNVAAVKGRPLRRRIGERGGP